MNIYLGIILAALLLEFFLYNLSRYLDLKYLSKELPLEFKDYYSVDEYARSQEYLIENTRFSYFISCFDLVVIFRHLFQRRTHNTSVPFQPLHPFSNIFKGSIHLVI